MTLGNGKSMTATKVWSL